MVKNIKKILVPLDGSRNSIRGLDEAIYLAKQCNATITGLHIIPTYPYPPSLADTIMPYRLYLEKEGQKFMEKAKKKAATKGIRFTKKLIYGSPINAITNMTKDKKFDLIVIGSRGNTGIKEVFFGSVANGVIHKSKVPVIVVK